MPEHIRLAYNRTMETLLELPIDGDQGSLKPKVLRLTTAAKAALRAFERWLEPQLGPLGELASMTDWVGKLAGAAVRIAGLLHMAIHVRDPRPRPWDEPIEKDTVDKAIQIAHYLLAHAQAAYALMGADPEVERASFLLSWLTAHQTERFTVRDLYQGTKGRFKKVADLKPALSLLVDHGFIREQRMPPRPGAGRKASPSYEVNPAMHAHNSHNSQNARSQSERRGPRSK